MAEIRYIASLSDNPDRLARFYGDYFGLTELGRSNEGDVSLTDGHYNFSVLKMRPELKEPRNEIGLHHIGLQVESISQVRDRYLKFNPRGTIAPEPTMNVDHVADAVVHMAALPLDANILFMTVMATNMPLVGRG